MNKNFLSLGYRTDFNAQTIILTKKFAKSASVVGSKDYTILCRLRKDYPDYSIVVREIAKKEGKVNPNRNLTYDHMRETITVKHGKESKELAALETVIVESKIKPAPYADRLHHEVFNAINLEEFTNRTFGLSYKPYSEVTLHAHKSLIDAVIDRFGMDVKLTPVSDNLFSFTRICQPICGGVFR